jgi:hypothetical protein
VVKLPPPKLKLKIKEPAPLSPEQILRLKKVDKLLADVHKQNLPEEALGIAIESLTKIKTAIEREDHYTIIEVLRTRLLKRITRYQLQDNFKDTLRDHL